MFMRSKKLTANQLNLSQGTKKNRKNKELKDKNGFAQKKRSRVVDHISCMKGATSNLLRRYKTAQCKWVHGYFVS